jgi:capsular polysaccharide biosynthesis protein
VTGREQDLDRLGLELGIDQASDAHDHLRKYEEQIARLGRAPAAIAVVGARDPREVGLAFARRYPSAVVHVLAMVPVRRGGTPANLVLHEVADLPGMHAVLRGVPGLDVLVDDGTHRKSLKLAMLRELLFHLRAGGLYVVEDLHALAIERLQDVEGEDVVDLLVRLVRAQGTGAARARLPAREAALADGVGEVTLWPRIAFVRKRGTHWLKVAEDEALADLAAARDAGWITESTVEPATDVVAEVPSTVNRADLRDRMRTRYRQPARRVRRYEDVVVEPRQLVHRDGLYLPETFRLYRQADVRHHRVRSVSPRHALPPRPVEPAPLAGTYFYLDSEHPSTYGHVVTEVMSRLWAWDAELARDPDLRALVSVGTGESRPPRWCTDLLAAAGVPAERVVAIAAPVRVERLVSATPLFSNPVVAHPRVREVWERTVAALAGPGTTDGLPARLFVGRKPGARRTCHNATALEELFVQRDFAVVYPEDHPIGTQVAMFARAEVVAGYGGSALINTAFSAPGVPRVVIAPEGYDAMNEYLIARVQGAPVHYFWCPADVPARRRWSVEAFLSDFTFDLRRDGDALVRLLDRLP